MSEQNDDSKRIAQLRKLGSVIVANVKREMAGRGSNLPKEQRAIKQVLTSLLGRKPTEDELKNACTF